MCAGWRCKTSKGPESAVSGVFKDKDSRSHAHVHRMFIKGQWARALLYNCVLLFGVLIWRQMFDIHTFGALSRRDALHVRWFLRSRGCFADACWFAGLATYIKTLRTPDSPPRAVTC
jgi:hypothetical protein